MYIYVKIPETTTKLNSIFSRIVWGPPRAGIMLGEAGSS